MAQISIEAALDAFRRKYGEAADENVLLHARVAELEEEIAGLRAMQERQATEPEPAPPVSPYPLDSEG